MSHRQQDRRVTTTGGSLNERFGRLEKPAPAPAPTTTKTVTTNIQTRASGSVFSRIQGRGPSVAAATPKRRQGAVPAIQARIGRASGGSIQKRVGQNMTSKSPKPTRRPGVVPNRGKQTTKLKAATAAVSTKHGSKGNGKAQLKKKTKPSSDTTAKGKKKPISADDLDKALDSYMMKDPKTAQAKLNDELDSYMEEAGDVLMDL